MTEVGLEEFSKFELRIAEIKGAEDISGSDKLLKLTVDVCGQERTLVAGIKKEYPKEQLPGKQIVMLYNLKPAVIRGVKSEGMLLAAVENDHAVLLIPDKNVSSGAPVK